MNVRFILHQLGNVHRQRLTLFRQKPQTIFRTVTTTTNNTQSQLSTRTGRWAITRYAVIIGFPLTTFLVYRFSTKAETRRKHRVILGSIGRAFQAISVGIRSLIDQRISLLFKHEGSDEYIAALQASRRRSAKRFANLCIDIGGVYVKIGQVLINLPEVIPLEYYEELQVLQERALRREKGEIDVLFKRYFRDIPENVYGKFNRNPKAAASLAEVYEAETKDGQRVAVKVQYSDLRERYETDITTVD